MNARYDTYPHRLLRFTHTYAWLKKNLTSNHKASRKAQKQKYWCKMVEISSEFIFRSVFAFLWLEFSWELYLSFRQVKRTVFVSKHRSSDYYL